MAPRPLSRAQPLQMPFLPSRAAQAPLTATWGQLTIPGYYCKLLDTASAVASLDSNYLFTTSGGRSNGVTLSAGNQRVTWVVPGSANYIYLRTVTAISGKTYCEFKCITEPATMTHGFGVQESPISLFYNNNPNGGSMFSGNGGCGLAAAGFYNANSVTSSGAYSFAVGDVIGVAFDPSTRKLWFSKNGTWISGDPAAGTSPTMTLAGGSTFYFTMGAYSCSISSGTYEYEVYPSLVSQTYAAPYGFSCYQP